MALAFGICDGVAPLLGLAIGRATAASLASLSDVLAPILLIGGGACELPRRQAEGEGGRGDDDDDRWVVLGLPLCLSLDDLVAGVAIGAPRWPVLSSAVAIGAISGAMSLAGLLLGRLARRTLPARVERLSGLVPIAPGVATAFDPS